MEFANKILSQERPATLSAFDLPRRERYHPSPADWRDEVLYFLLPDRFSDGREASRPLIDRNSLPAARPALPDGSAWHWQKWSESGALRWQGGTIQGVRSKLGYIRDLGATTIWLGPVFKQRAHLNTYHGYGIQDFLEVDARFGTRRDLVELVEAAHAAGLRVILDIIFNHTGANWVYPGGQQTMPYKHFPDRYAFGKWLGVDGQLIDAIQGSEDGVWPREFQDPDFYTRAGRGDLGAGDINDQFAEHKRSDFINLRDLDVEVGECLKNLAKCFKYWIALTDCDGFRIDTLKHVSFEQARNFCGAIKEFAAGLGKADFFLVGEVAGGDFGAGRYLDVLERNLNAALDIGEMRMALNQVAKGAVQPASYFNGFKPGAAAMGSHRNLGKRHVSILDDHDHVFGDKVRFSSFAASPIHVVTATALQLFSLGVPCIYYGTEQSFAGPEPSERHWLPAWNNSGAQYSTRYLREAMFGPEHPLKDGRAGLAAGPERFDQTLPGFGPFGTAGRHCFDSASPAYVRIAALAAARRDFPALRYGRQYQRDTAGHDQPLQPSGAGGIVAWSRILDEEECVCVVNTSANTTLGADVLVDSSLNPNGAAMRVLVNTAQAGGVAAPSQPDGTDAPVRRHPNGTAFIRIDALRPGEVLVFTNRP